MTRRPPFDHSSSRTTRRGAIAGAVAAACSIPIGAFGETSTSLHAQVAQKVRALTRGQPLDLRLLLPHGSLGNVGPVIAKFSAMTGVQVKVTEVPVDEINTELTLDALSNTRRYDIALPATFGLIGLVAANAILPITNLAAQHEPPGFRDGILYDVGDRIDRELYGFQTDGDAYMMFYHQEMLTNPANALAYKDKFGTPLERPLTWEELDQQMAFFHRPDEGQFGGLLFRKPGFLAWEWWVRFHAKGVWPFSPDMTPQIASDPGIEALEEMKRATDHLHPASASLGLFGNWERFGKGDIYCNIGWGGTQKFLNAPGSDMRGKMEYGPTPGGMVNGNLLVTPYFNWGWNYVVSSTTDSPEISYLFALFASTPEMSTLAVRQNDGFFDPFRPEHYEDAGIQSAYTPDFLSIHRNSLETAIPDLYLKDQGEYLRVLTKWLGRALSGDAAPKHALERVAQRWELITNGSGRRAQIARWNRLRARYPANVRAALRDL